MPASTRVPGGMQEASSRSSGPGVVARQAIHTASTGASAKAEAQEPKCHDRMPPDASRPSGRTEMRVVEHVGNQAVGRGGLRISGDELFEVFTLEEIEYLRLVADDLEIGVIHEKLSETERPAAVVDVSCGFKRGMQNGKVPAGIENLNDFPIHNSDSSDPPRKMWRRSQRSQVQDDVVAGNLHASSRILIHEL